jgi:GTP-binding protein
MKSNLIHFVQWLFLAVATSDYASAFVSPSTRIRTVGFLSSTAAEEEETVKTTLSTKDDGDFSFFDEASIYVRAGSGGQGSSTWKKAKKGANGIPDGGSGGRGGNIVLVLDPSLNTLAGLSRRALRPNAFGGGGAAASSKRMGRHLNKLVDDDDESAINENNFVVRERLLSFRAEDGRAGGRMYDNGRCGEDCEVRVPPGTVVKLEFSNDDGDSTDEENNTDDDDDDDDESINNTAGSSTSSDDEGPQEEYDHIVELGTVSYENPSLIVARGGKGGEGTAVLKGKKNGATRRGPVGGERFRVRLTLKIVADIALVGVPNAGKVSLFLFHIGIIVSSIQDKVCVCVCVCVVIRLSFLTLNY